MSVTMNKKMKTKTTWTSFMDNSNSKNNNSKNNNVRKSSSISKILTSPVNNNSSSKNSKINKIKSASDITGKGLLTGLLIEKNPKMTTTTTTTTETITTTQTVVIVRPNTLNVSKEGPNAETRLFIREALNAWRTKARCNVVPAERLQELFNELQFSPSEKQISEMLQTAKVFARKSSRQLNGLTFGEFCVLAADLKRLRACNLSSSNDSKTTISSLITNAPDINSIENSCCNVKTVPTSSPLSSRKNLQNTTSTSPQLSRSPLSAGSTTTTTTINNSNSNSNNSKPDNLNSDNNSKTNSSSDNSVIEINQSNEANIAPEVFLGGSCNPTTWRADVAIPTLKKLGISFYNPQVSDWTPDLIELEHHAKEKARVLFFVMDSETRASAGAIEVAHIAGQNARQLVLVLHPYKPDQCILNEPISPQEYLDLSRNQQLLRELVSRRGIPVLSNIREGLQRTKAILAGIREPPSNIASILIVVRGAFDRVVDSLDEEITIKQCQRALSFLGYANSLITIDNLKSILLSHKEMLKEEKSTITTTSETKSENSSPRSITKEEEIRINFDEFCLLASYLSVLQQEIYESGCISPIKGIDVHPPPIFLANMQEGIHNRNDEGFYITTSYSKQILRTSSCSCVPDDRHISSDVYRNRDSGTSSPQPSLPIDNLKSKYIHIGKRSKISVNVEYIPNGETVPGDESDSNDSVFSSGSSVNSNFCENNLHGIEFRDVYLGGSCFLRSRWRQENAIPYLESKGITYHLPALHESILPSQLKEEIDKSDKIAESSKKTRTKRKERASQQTKLTQEDDVNDESLITPSSSSSTIPIRPNLFNPALLEASRVLLFVITNETRSLAPMTLAAHCIGLMYNVVLCVQMLPEFCMIGNERLTPAAIKDYNRGRAYLIDLAKRQGVPVFNDLKSALDCVIEKVKACNSRNSV